MPTVRVAQHLAHQFPIPRKCVAKGRTVAEVIADLERQYPGVSRYLLEDHAALRQHVNVFIGEKPVADRNGLSDPVSEDVDLFIMQALSGG
jgi:hypothetical protein